MRIAKHSDPLEVQRFSLAEKMVTLEARTHTIRRWTGLSEGRVRSLYRLHAQQRGLLVRHRGPAPHLVGFFLKNPRLRSEASALAALCSTLKIIPAGRVSHARRELPSVQRGEALCRAYEFYRGLVGESVLTLEHAVLLVTAIAQGMELALDHCIGCGGAMIFGPADVGRRVCSACREEGQWEREPATQSSPAALEWEGCMVQQSLF